MCVILTTRLLFSYAAFVKNNEVDDAGRIDTLTTPISHETADFDQNT